MAFFASIESRKQAAFIINSILLVSSLILIGTGASLMGFYRLHLLSALTIDFVIVPTVLTGGGLLTLLIAFFGFAAFLKEDGCYLYWYASLVSIDFIFLIAGIASSVRLLFDIQVGFLSSDVISELKLYESDTWVQYKWDTLQSEFTCCGAYGYHQGYTDWKKTIMGAHWNSVPDSCCLTYYPGCGSSLFDYDDLREVITKINIHGCIPIMKTRLKTHVNYILMTFAGVGGILAVLQLMIIVLSCCLASNFSQGDDFSVYDYETRSRGGSISKRYHPGTETDFYPEPTQEVPTSI